MNKEEYILSLITHMGFKQNEKNNNIYYKKYVNHNNYEIQVDFKKKKILFRDDNKTGIEDEKIYVGDETTANFSKMENFVVLECVNRLLVKGYQPNHIWLERKWKLGRSAKSGKADINVFDKSGKTLFIIECKTFGKEYEDEKLRMEQDGGQLFSYLQQDKNTKFLCLYTSIFNNDKIHYENLIVKIKDREEDKEAYRKGNESVKLYEFANNKQELYDVWKETFNLYFHLNGIFDEDVNAYEIELKPLKKKNLKVLEDHKKVFYQFLEILRHNNISDNANAFNRMLSLFLCKIVDEEKEDDEILDFQVKEGQDTFEAIQDRLQHLYKRGMEKYLKEKIVYYEDKAISDIINQYPKQTVLDEIHNIFKEIKYYTNNEFAFKEVHNRELFKQNGRVLNEVIKLIQNYKFKYSNKQQMLGDFFELLLNHGVKQSEGQFFTPVPIATFIINSILIDEFIINNIESGSDEILPKILDYACGAGHFLTESIDKIQEVIKGINETEYNEDMQRKICTYKNNTDWASQCIFGIEKDYRLTRTAQIACFLNGDGQTNIILGDGLEEHDRLKLSDKKFDYVIANPPYSVKNFKKYLNINNNNYILFDELTDSSQEIEALFIERTKQVLRNGGKAAIILPTSILTTAKYRYNVKIRELLLESFEIKAIVELGGETFIATDTKTVIMFLERRDDNFSVDRKYIADDLILNSGIREYTKDFINSSRLLKEYTEFRGVDFDDYVTLINREPNETIKEWEMYIEYNEWFENLTDVKNLRNKASFKQKSDEEQNKDLMDLFLDRILVLERDKFYFFLLCMKNGKSRDDENYYTSQNVVVANTGRTTKDQKQFLGYEVRNDRENQGISMIGEGKLVDINDVENSKKVNSYIRKAYRNEEIINIDQELVNNINVLELCKMIDFEQIDFDKQIMLQPIENTNDNSSWQDMGFEEGIDYIKLGVLCDFVRGPFGGALKKESFVPKSDYKVYEQQHAIQNDFSIERYFITKEKYEQMIRFKVNPGDLIMSCSGTIGKIAIAPDNIDDGIINQALLKIIPKDKNKLLPNYLKIILESEQMKKIIAGYSHGKGIKNITSVKVLKNIKIPVPKKDTQTKIIENAENIQSEINKMKAELKKNENTDLLKNFLSSKNK